MTWIGRKKLALIPLYRTNPRDVIPPDWEDQIRRRVLFDPETGSGADRALRTYIHTASSGRADLDAVVMPRESADQQAVPVDFLEPKLGAQLRAQGFDAAAIVMLGEPGASGTSELGRFWARFVTAEDVGVWAMEFMHVLTGFWDLYGDFVQYLGNFDEMACNCGTHPTAYTKAAIGWLDASAVVEQRVHVGEYSLHSVGLIQPPPSGRVAAVRIGSHVPYLMVEARQRVDQFDARIPSEGVIVYRVETDDPLGRPNDATAPVKLLTPQAYIQGETFTSDSLVVEVTAPIPGGFKVSVTRPIPALCAEILQQIAAIDKELQDETDPEARKGLLAQKGRLSMEAGELGCPPPSR
jgi:hypothetical protein